MALPFRTQCSFGVRYLFLTTTSNTFVFQVETKYIPVSMVLIFTRVEKKEKEESG